MESRGRRVRQPGDPVCAVERKLVACDGALDGRVFLITAAVDREMGTTHGDTDATRDIEFSGQRNVACGRIELT